jgi:predicted Holliday junction resolvase-like endonuclease
METFVYAILSVVIFGLLVAIVAMSRRPSKVELPDIEAVAEKLRFALASEASVREIQDMLRSLPRDVLESITRSLGKRTGKLNELMATFELTQYDRLFYLGEPIDFVGIKYDEGVDFIEVKTGRFRLSADEQRLRELIEAGRVNYVPLTVERIGIAEEVETWE